MSVYVVVQIDVTDPEKARAWYDSPEYGEARAARHSAANVKMILVEGPSYDPRAASASA